MTLQDRSPIHDPMIPHGQEKGLTPIDFSAGGSKEKPRVWVANVREMDFGNPEELQSYVDFLNYPTNRLHFAGPPETIEDLQEMAANKSYHFLSALNSEEETVGGMLIEDAPFGQHDHWLRLVVVDPKLQNPILGKSRGTGTAMIRKGLDWAATTLTSHGKIRHKVDASVIKGVSGWQAMQHILKDKLPFRYRMTLPGQVDVEDPKTGQIIRRSTERYEIDLNLWRSVRELPEPEERQASQSS